MYESYKVEIKFRQQTKANSLIGCLKPQIILVSFAGSNESLLMTSAEHLCCLDYISLDLFGWGGFYPL